MESVISNFEGFDELKAETKSYAYLDWFLEIKADYSNFELEFESLFITLKPMIGNRFSRKVLRCFSDAIIMGEDAECDFAIPYHFTFTRNEIIFYVQSNRLAEKIVVGKASQLERLNSLSMSKLANYGQNYLMTQARNNKEFEELWIIDIIRKSRNPIYYKMTPQEGKNPVFELIVRVSV